MTAKLDLTINQGSTFNHVVRWGAGQAYVTIQSILSVLPLKVTATAHGITDGWSVNVNIGDLRSDAVKATVIDADTLLFPVMNTEYFRETQGVISYAPPVDMTGFTARMQIRAKITDSSPLINLTTGNGGIVIDNTLKTITIVMTASQTAAFTFTNGVYDLEMTSSGSQVTRLLQGNVILSKEVTHD